ncbi:hypothetical protein [Eisenbergiella massiliensis]|uniref:ImmA/IrrE family metallo-endopeptidase n=1 Tax=Eisenbergiella massiliensis TaxID=1720294 RepID=A0A3E3I9Z3_9FIRM|nr:hypothetical protein [Eisenbergiella massiliensis]RGE63853.1 hypothetical protein DWY69_27530 [Eisenbergiella massiliensis]
MDCYETLIDRADQLGISVIEIDFKGRNGRIMNDTIFIRRDMLTVGKSCATSEELGHHFTGAGDILNQNLPNNAKQEKRGKIWAYNDRVGLRGIIKAYCNGCRNLYEMADTLDVTEDFLQDALDYFHSKFGQYTILDNYVIYFEPALAVFDLIA